VKPQPWKNGGGVTRELLAWPTAEDWLIRISVADIEKDGPFSAFPGIRRTITVLSGAGIWLDAPLDVELRPKDPPFTYSGDLAPRCELLRGPTRDLNAMFDEKAGVGRLQRWRTGHETKRKRVSFALDLKPPTLFGVFTLAAATLLTRSSELALPPMSLAWTTAPIPDMQLHSSPQAWAFHYTMSK
jgi:environmental stress-induced protein Ves